MNESYLSTKRERISDRVAVEPVCATRYAPPSNAPREISDLEAELRLYGEVEITVEERGTVELHRGNTEFDYETFTIRVDTRDNVISVAMDRVTDHEVHYHV